MRILVTGGAGFVGCNLIRYLLEKTDRSVLNLDKLTYAANHRQLREFDKHPAYQFCKIDLADNADTLQQVVTEYGPDRIVHLAAESHVDRSIEGPRPFVSSNIVGTFNLLEATRGYIEKLPEEERAEFLFVHMSTDEVYGTLADGEAKFDRRSPYRPQSPYSACKAASDHLVRAWQNTFAFPAAIAICTNTFGAFQHPEKLIPKTISKALQGEPIPVYGNGANMRDWIYVEDCVKAVVAIAENGRPDATYHIGAENEVSNLELVNTLCDILDERFAERKSQLGSCDIDSYRELVSFVPDRPGHDFRYALDTQQTQRELGWAPEWNFDDALDKTVQHYADLVLSTSRHSTQ